ncbi:MAG TPA: hotdog domain-containing protein [Miltoncostaeaceae bacterium]|nr:hotdog domain-containing protein [Miltoncostaeaceae bacterium]
MSDPRFRFSLRTRVDLADTDLGAVVYYGRYPHYIDRAVIAYRRELGVAPLGPPGHLFVVRSLQIDYRSSARFDDRLEVFVRTGEVGRTSHTVDVRITRPGEDGPESIADARLVIVGLAAYGGRPSRMPDDMRRALCEFEGLDP